MDNCKNDFGGCGTDLTKKPHIHTPSGELCIECWCTIFGEKIEKYPDAIIDR